MLVDSKGYWEGSISASGPWRQLRSAMKEACQAAAYGAASELLPRVSEGSRALVLKPQCASEPPGGVTLRFAGAVP